MGGGYEAAPDLIRAGGAVVWRGDERDPEIALIHRPKHDDWTFPKGKLNHGEHLLSATVREVHEETGLRVVLGPWLSPVLYSKSGWFKRVDYWAARVDKQEFFASNDEVGRVVWSGLDEARKRLTFGRDTAVLDAFRAAPLRTTPLILVRHGQPEGSADDWKGKKRLRPLSDIGESQAQSLASVLHAYRPASLVSAPTERCLQTLGPYAARELREIRHEAVFTKKNYNPAEAVRQAIDAMDSDVPTVICGHREALEGTLNALWRERSDGLLGKLHLFKGSLAVVHHVAGQVVGLERYLV